MSNGRTLGSIVEQIDLGVQLHVSLKVTSQVNTMVNKAFGTLAFISEGFDWEVMLQLHKAWPGGSRESCVGGRQHQ